MYIDSVCEQNECARAFQRNLSGMLFRWSSVVLASSMLAITLYAQSTLAEPTSRAESISFLEAEKAKVTRPPTPDKAEALVRRMVDIFLVDPAGFFPYFDSVYQGGG